MLSFSRRQLAGYAVEQLLAGRPVAIIAKQLAAALAQSGKLKEVDLLLVDIDHLLEDRGLVAKAHIKSAFPLPPALRQKLISEIKKITAAKDVELVEGIDRAVIGGLKIETANHSWDKTIARTLTDIRGMV